MLLSSPRFTELTRDYVLAWDNLRPIPKLTIDFGNGETLVRTLKGSTVMYRCRPDGAVIDAYPGISTPNDFAALWTESNSYQNQSALQILQWHRRNPGAAPSAPASPLTVSKATIQSPLLARISPEPVAANAPKPLITVSKAVVESPLIGPVSGENPARLYDLSEEALSREQVLARAGLPADATPLQIVAADSQRYRTLAYPRVRALLGSFAGLPQPEQCKLPIFKGILQVPIDDPYLGLKHNLPGTP